MQHVRVSSERPAQVRSKRLFSEPTSSPSKTASWCRPLKLSSTASERRSGCCRSRRLTRGILGLCRATNSLSTKSCYASACRSAYRSRIFTADWPSCWTGTFSSSKRRPFTATPVSPHSTRSCSLSSCWSVGWKIWSATAVSASIVVCGSISSTFSATRSIRTCLGTPPLAAPGSSTQQQDALQPRRPRCPHLR